MKKLVKIIISWFRKNKPEGPHLIMHIEADNVELDDKGDIVMWVDRSGNGNHLYIKNRKDEEKSNETNL